MSHSGWGSLDLEAHTLGQRYIATSPLIAANLKLLLKNKLY